MDDKTQEIKMTEKMSQEDMALNYFECYPDALEELCDNTTILGLQLRKNGYFEQAMSSNLQFEVLDHFDLLRSPVWKLVPDDAALADFSLLSVYRVHRRPQPE